VGSEMCIRDSVHTLYGDRASVLQAAKNIFDFAALCPFFEGAIYEMECVSKLIDCSEFISYEEVAVLVQGTLFKEAGYVVCTVHEPIVGLGRLIPR